MGGGELCLWFVFDVVCGIDVAGLGLKLGRRPMEAQ